MITEKIKNIFLSLDNKEDGLNTNQTVIVVLICIIIGTIAFYFIDLSSYKNTIKVQDEIISNIRKSDSIYNTQLNKQSRQLSKYYSDTSFKYKGQSYSASSLINELASAQMMSDFYDSTNTRLINERIQLLDSIYELNVKLGLIKQSYGIQVIKRKTEENIFRFTLSNSSADTALELYSYFRDRLTFDSTGRYIIKLNNNSTVTSKSNFHNSNSVTLKRSKR